MEHYTVVLEFKGGQAKTPKDAAEQIATYLVNHAKQLVFDVTDSIGNTSSISVKVSANNLLI